MIRILIAAVAALALALGWSLWRAEVHKGDAEQAETALASAESALNNERAARANEHKAADRMADIGDKHEEDRRDAAGVPAAVVADLQSGVIELRPQWSGCATDRLAAAVSSAVELDALQQLREQDAGRLIEIGREADDHVRGLQAVVISDRTPIEN